jgi:hypothetical protein
MKVESFLDVGRSEKSGFKKDNKFLHKKSRHEGEWNRRQDPSRGEKPKQFEGSGFKPKGNFVKKGALFKASQPKGDVGRKPKGTCFNYNEVGHYSKDCPKSKSGNGGFKVITLNANLAQAECNRLIFLKGKIIKWDVFMSFGHMGFSQLHNPRKRRKDGVPIGGVQSTHRGALCGWGSPSHYVTSKESAFSTRKLERRWTCWFPPWVEWIAFWEWSSSPKTMCS